MVKRDITSARNPDLRASPVAMHRAAQLARRIAIDTNTELVIMRDGLLVTIPATELRAAEQ